MRKILISFGAWLLPGLALAEQIENPLTGVNSFDVLYINVLNAILGLLGGVAFIFVIYGGMLFLFSGGNEERIEKGKKTFYWAILGVTVVIMSYSIIQFLYAKLL